MDIIIYRWKSHVLVSFLERFPLVILTIMSLMCCTDIQTGNILKSLLFWNVRATTGTCSVTPMIFTDPAEEMLAAAMIRDDCDTILIYK